MYYLIEMLIFRPHFPENIFKEYFTVFSHHDFSGYHRCMPERMFYLAVTDLLKSFGICPKFL